MKTKRNMDYNKVGFIYKKKKDKSTYIIILHTKRQFNSFYKLINNKQVKPIFVFDKAILKGILKEF